MSLTPAVIRSTRDGVDGWLDLNTSRWLPRVAGADDDDAAAAAAKDAADKAAADAKTAADAQAAKDKADADAAKKGEDEKLGEGGKAALEAERTARKAAEKAAKAAQDKLQAIEDAKLSDADKAKKEADDAKTAAANAVAQLREAKLLVALGDHNLTGAKAKAAAKLIEGVEYDDTTNEPTNLEAVLASATETYGEDIFKGATPKPKPPVINGGEGDQDRDGPTLTADELAMAKNFGMTPEEYASFKSTQPSVPATT